MSFLEVIIKSEHNNARNRVKFIFTRHYEELHFVVRVNNIWEEIKGFIENNIQYWLYLYKKEETAIGRN